MISTIEIYRAIRERLEEIFPNVTIAQKDDKNIVRPSFYIQYIGKSFSKLAQTIYEDRISFNIVYFSENEELIELLEIEEAFTTAFNMPLKIQDDSYIIEVEKDSLQSNLNEEDYFLNLTIDFVLSQREIETTNVEELNALGEPIENMEEIDVTLKQ